MITLNLENEMIIDSPAVIEPAKIVNPRCIKPIKTRKRFEPAPMKHWYSSYGHQQHGDIALNKSSQ